MNNERIVKIMVDKVEKIIKHSNAENNGADNKLSKKSVVNEILSELDRVVKDEN